MKYITITAPHPRKYYVGRRLLGTDEYTIIATCTSEHNARDIVEKLRTAEYPTLPLEVEATKPLKKKVALV